MSTALKRQPIPFGKYLLLDRINIGGMAEVWRAKTFGAGGFERLVAIKRILPNIAEDEEFITMFIDEAKITVQLNHANIAQIYELANISNSYFIAMEYISGKDMRAVFDRCRKRGEPAPIPLTCYLIARCCEGLDYAHRNKDRMGNDMAIVHRDVSPQNALISYDGEVKVIDFGIAKAAGKATKTQAGILKGKFGYMSPEQIRGLPLDRRSDVFALGICLYEMLTGERLFVGDSDFSVLEKVRKVEVLPPSHFNRRIPDALEKIVMKALAKDVEDRYQYASELGDALQRFSLTADTVFGRKELAAFMKSTFAEEVDKEKQRLLEYGDIKPPAGMHIEAGNVGNYPGPVPVLSVPPAAPNSSVVTGAQTSMTGASMPDLTGSTAPVPLSQMETAMGLPQVTRQPAPPAPSSSAPTIMPRLTAAAASTTSGKEEHVATQLVDSSKPFDPERTSPGELDSPDMITAGAPFRLNSTKPTDPDRGPVGRESARAPNIDEAFAPTRASPNRSPPSLAPTEAQRRPLALRAPLSTPPPPISDSEQPAQRRDGSSLPLRAPSPEPYVPRMAPAEKRPKKTRAPAPPPASGNGLVIAAVVAVVLAVAVGVLVLTGAFKPASGLLVIDLPEEVWGQAHVNVNGRELTEALPNGSTRLYPEWPQMMRVGAGKVTVMVTVTGYEPYLTTVEIKEGAEPTKLNAAMNKKETPEREQERSR